VESGPVTTVICTERLVDVIQNIVQETPPAEIPPLIDRVDQRGRARRLVPDHRVAAGRHWHFGA
jgi:hypothetical protein